MLCSHGGLSPYQCSSCIFREELRLELENFVGERLNEIELGLQVSFLDKQNIFDLFALFNYISMYFFPF